MPTHAARTILPRTSRNLAVVIMPFTLLLAGCFEDDGGIRVQTVTLDTSPPTTVHMLTQTTDNGDDDALLEGTLVLTGGCLQVSEPTTDTSHTIIWPEGTRLTPRDAQISVLQPGGNEFARVGEQVRVGGGEWGGDLPSHCGGFLWGSDGF